MRSIFRKHNIIKHKEFKDIAYRVLSCFEAPNRYKIKAELINQGYVKSYVVTPGNVSRIEIEKDKVKDWLVCLQPDLDCIRYSTWM